MAIYVEINGVQYPASVAGRMHDEEWDNRESKAITLEMNYADAAALFVDDIDWNILQDQEIQKEIEDGEGNITFESQIEQIVYNNSDFCVAGPIIDHRNGTITVKMGKPTLEELFAIFEEVL